MSFVMQIWWRMERMSWKDRVTYEAVLSLAGKKRKVIETIQAR